MTVEVEVDMLIDMIGAIDEALIRGDIGAYPWVTWYHMILANSCVEE